jgi:Flp pilus assembly protein protease CpaA
MTKMAALGSLAVFAGLVCMYTDGKFRRLPNPVTFGCMLLAPVITLVFHGKGPSFWMSLAGIAMAVAVNIIPSLIGLLKMGDLKMMMGFGAIFGPYEYLKYFLVFAVLNGAVALVFLIWNKYGGRLAMVPGLPEGIKRSVMDGQDPEATLDTIKKKQIWVPFGVAMGASAIAFVGYVFRFELLGGLL